MILVSCFVAATWAQFFEVVGASTIGYIIGRGAWHSVRLMLVRWRNGHP